MKNTMDPYRYFFPAGWLIGVWGVLLWILFPWGLISYPGLHHPDIMMGGFFLCFVCGFLMTAAPRFTGTMGASVFEQRVSTVLIAILFVASLANYKSFFYVTVLALFLHLAFFVLRRFRRRQNSPPNSFLFLGFGLASGVLGTAGLLAAEFLILPLEIHALSRLFFIQTYILCLVVGVGSRLIPALLGFAPLPTEAGTVHSPTKGSYIFLGISLLATYILEVFGSRELGLSLRALLLTYILVFIWKLYRWPQRKAAQTFGLWISSWTLLLGHWALIFFPDSRVHILHVILISGLTLMTLMIAVRVTLSHGKHDMALERKSKALIWAGILIFLAGFTRLSAGFAPRLYQSHLLYAAITWILAMIIWGVVFIPKMIRIEESEEDRC